MHPSNYRERVEFSFSIIFYNVSQLFISGTNIKIVKKQGLLYQEPSSTKIRFN